MLIEQKIMISKINQDSLLNRNHHIPKIILKMTSLFIIIYLLNYWQVKLKRESYRRIILLILFYKLMQVMDQYLFLYKHHKYHILKIYIICILFLFSSDFKTSLIFL